MTLPEDQQEATNFTIYIKKQMSHLLSNPVFYPQNPPQLSKATIDLHNPNTNLNVGCYTCINKDLQEKKIQEEIRKKEKDQQLITANRRKMNQKQDKELRLKKQKQDWYIKDLTEHARLHSAQKAKDKQRQIQQTQNIMKIMKSQILVKNQKEKRKEREKCISQIQLRSDLESQLKEKQEQKQRQSLKNKNVQYNPTCIPSNNVNTQKNNSKRTNYKLDLDEMIKERQSFKRNSSSEVLEKERQRLLKVIEKEQLEEKKIQRKKQLKRRQQTQVMQKNIILTENKKKENQQRILKQNKEPVKAFFDEQKRKEKQQQKQNRWKQQLRGAMKEASNLKVEVRQKEDVRNSRAFSSYRSRERSLSRNKSSEGLKIVVHNDKVCCSKCHEAKPSFAVGNYNFNK